MSEYQTVIHSKIIYVEAIENVHPDVGLLTYVYDRLTFDILEEYPNTEIESVELTLKGIRRTDDQ